VEQVFEACVKDQLEHVGFSPEVRRIWLTKTTPVAKALHFTQVNAGL